MIAEVEVKGERPWRYVYIEMGDPVCGEDFCDGCGDCLACQKHGEEDWCSAGWSRWVIYEHKERHPTNLEASDPRRIEYEQKSAVPTPTASEES